MHILGIHSMSDSGYVTGAKNFIFYILTNSPDDSDACGPVLAD